MNRDVIVNGSPARLRVVGATFEYARLEGTRASGSFSITPMDSGAYLVQLGRQTGGRLPPAAGLPHGSEQGPIEIGPQAEACPPLERSLRVTVGPAGEVSVNGRSLRMEVFDPRNLRAGAQTSAQPGRQRISAPMPGKVVRVLVVPGDAVEAGQGLVVVEAMKMQNEMKAPQAGRVVEVHTQADATVAAGDILIVVE